MRAMAVRLARFVVMVGLAASMRAQSADDSKVAHAPLSPGTVSELADGDHRTPVSRNGDGPTAAAPHTFTVQGDRFLYDGKPFQVLSGEIHYPRIPREYWRGPVSQGPRNGAQYDHDLCVLECA